jgi:hypothetical protein
MLAGQEGNVEGIREKIESEVGGWPGVEARAHRFGGVEFRVNGHEIGHLHGERMADLPFPVRMREELVAAGAARVHHVLPQTGWVSYRIHQPEDVEGRSSCSGRITSG